MPSLPSNHPYTQFGPSLAQRNAQRASAHQAQLQHAASVNHALAAQLNAVQTSQQTSMMGGSMYSQVGTGSLNTLASGNNWVTITSTPPTNTIVYNGTTSIANPHTFPGGIPQVIIGGGSPSPLALLEQFALEDGHLKIPDNYRWAIELPDGTLINIKGDGSYELNDKDAKVVYRACRVRDFNKFLNVSDRLEEFIKYCDEVGVRSDEMLKLPIDLFIAWVCLEAAKMDKEPEPNLRLLPRLTTHAKPRCLACARFISRKMKAKAIEVCNPKCFERHYTRAIA